MLHIKKKIYFSPPSYKPVNIISFCNCCEAAPKVFTADTAHVNHLDYTFHLCIWLVEVHRKCTFNRIAIIFFHECGDVW